MKSEGVQEKGHLQINKNIIIDLTDIHLRLLKDPKESEYIGVYYNTLPYIVELRSKTTDKEVPELETCFTALYGYMLLNIQKKEISKETQAAITQITSLLRLLSKKYKEIDQQE
jgi:flagellin-specific chaperone FliS